MQPNFEKGRPQWQNRQQSRHAYGAAHRRRPSQNRLRGVGEDAPTTGTAPEMAILVTFMAAASVVPLMTPVMAI